MYECNIGLQKSEEDNFKIVFLFISSIKGLILCQVKYLNIYLIRNYTY